MVHIRYFDRDRYVAYEDSAAIEAAVKDYFRLLSIEATAQHYRYIMRRKIRRMVRI